MPFGRTHYWAVLTHLLFFPAMIAVGVLLPASTLNGQLLSRNELGNSSLEILFYASLVSCAFWIWKMKGLRWFAAGLTAFMELFIVGALFAASMSVSGDWL